jgi:hypothetical protein
MLMMICLTTSVGALRLFLNQHSFSKSPCIQSNLLNQSLVDSHLESIPGLRSFTARGLSGGNLEGLGWQTDGALDTEVLGLGTLDELLADLLERGDLSAGQGDSDLVSFLRAQMLVCWSNFAIMRVDVLGLRHQTPSLAFGKTLLAEFPSRLELCSAK